MFSELVTTEVLHAPTGRRVPVRRHMHRRPSPFPLPLGATRRGHAVAKSLAAFPTSKLHRRGGGQASSTDFNLTN